MINTRLGKARTERSAHDLYSSKAGRKVELLPPGNIIIRGMHVQPETANRGKAGTGPETGLDVGGHYTSYRSFQRHPGQLIKRSQPGAFVQNNRFQAYHQQLKPIPAGQKVTRLALASGKEPRTGAADVFCSEGKVIGMVRHCRRLNIRKRNAYGERIPARGAPGRNRLFFVWVPRLPGCLPYMR